MSCDTTPTVDAIGAIHFEGNIIPASWYKALRFPNGKPDLVAIILLAEIVYWYRPSITFDERTGQPCAIRKKFKCDKFSRSYQAFADQFGVTKRQAQDAITRLKYTYGVLHTETRTVKTEHGTLGNVLFLEPLPEKILAITHQRTPLYVETEEGARSNGGAPAVERQTYSEISTEITEDPPLSAIADIPPAGEVATVDVEAGALPFTPEDFQALYNSEAPEGLPRLKTLSAARRRKMRTALRQYPSRAFWQQVLQEVAMSAFLRGERPSNGHPHFRCSVDWLLSKGKADGTENYIKVCEGRYRDEAPTARPLPGHAGHRIGHYGNGPYCHTCQLDLGGG